MASIFADSKLFTRYRVRLQFKDKLLGGISKDAKIIPAWILARSVDIDELEFKKRVRDTLVGLGAPLPDGIDYDTMLAIAEAWVNEKHTNGFLRDDQGLYVEGRQVKAMLKECCNSQFAHERWGKTRKGPKDYLAERVFVDEQRIYLGRMEPDGVERVIGHIRDKTGRRSTLTNYEYVDRPTIGFTMLSLDDCITHAQWLRILEQGERIGLGATRSQAYGQFTVEEFTLAGARDLALAAD